MSPTSSANRWTALSTMLEFPPVVPQSKDAALLYTHHDEPAGDIVPMRVSRVRVEDLFGIFTHDVHLNRNAGITIIHAPNGFGKTVLLRLVSGVLSGKFNYIRTVSFNLFEIFFDDSSSLRITRKFVPSKAETS
jgi:hypothetical protein